MRLICFILLELAHSQFSCASDSVPLYPPGIYFSQVAPKHKPEIFAPGIFSLPDCLDGGFAMSADGRLMCFSRKQNQQSPSHLYVSIYHENRWSQPVKVPGQAVGKHWLFPTFTPNDSKRIYFTEGPPTKLKVAILRQGSWIVEEVSSPSNATIQWGFTQTSDRKVLFGSPIKDEDHDLFVATRSRDGFGEATRLPKPINTTAHETRPHVSADGDYLIFESNRGGGEPNLYVSFSTAKGDGTNWTTPVPLGSGVNTKALEDGPWVSPDGKFLFFRRLTKDNHGQSVSNIYWVSISVIRERDPRVR